MTSRRLSKHFCRLALATLLTISGATGLAYELAAHWSATGTLRYAEWFLPSEPARDSFGDEASLTGPNEVISVAFGLAYRLAL